MMTRIHSLRAVRTLFTTLCLALLLLGSTACVHEFPEPPAKRSVQLIISHQLPWSYFDFYAPGYNRSADARAEVANALFSRYIYKVYPAGDKKNCIMTEVRYRTDLSGADFTEDLDVPAGDWDIYVWNDYADAAKASLFYNAEDFSHIQYLYPYRGDSEYKDAFVGMISVSVPVSTQADVPVSGRILLERPLAAYGFIATDYQQFIINEIRRRGTSPNMAPAADPTLIPDLDRYYVKISYTAFLPSVYNIFVGNPIDSTTGVSFTAPLRALNNDQAMLGFDYIFVNGKNSTVKVALQIYDPDDNLIGSTNSIDVPIERSQFTRILGKFLTSKASGGAVIMADFDGEYNIQFN